MIFRVEPMLKSYKQLLSLTTSIENFRCNIKDILSAAKLETHNEDLALASTYFASYI